MQTRPYVADDAATAVAFLAEAAAADATLRPVTAVGWRDYLAESWNRGGRDFRLAVGGDGAVAGILMSSRVEDVVPVRNFRVIVHPALRGRGVGSLLFAEVERQDPAGTVVEQASCESGWLAGQAFLERRQFACEATSHDMERDGPAPAPSPLPRDVRLRPDRGDDGDAAAWIALSEEGYRGTPGYSPLTADDVARHRAQPGSHVWVAEATTGQVLGHCRTVLWQGEDAWIDSVVVTDAARGRGLGRALTVAGVRTLGAAGHARVRLNVRGDNEPARRIYASLGFRVTGEVRTYRRRREVR
jgi:mycothiol synthase